MDAKEINFRITKNFSFLILAQVFYKILTFLVMILLARFLGVGDFGRLSFGISFVWVFLFLSDLGCSELFVRDVSLNTGFLKKYTDNMTAFKIVLSFTAYIVLVIFGRFFSGNDPIKFWIVAVLGLSIILDSFVYYFRAVFRIKGTLHYEALLLIFEGFIKFIILFFAITYKFQNEKVLIVVLALLAVSAVNFLVNLFIFIRYNSFPELKFDNKFWVYLVKAGLPFSLVYILSLVNFRVDVLMLSLLRGDVEAGIFSADFRLIEQLFLFPAILSYVILPEFLRLSGHKDKVLKLAKRIIVYLFLLSMAIIILFSFFSNSIISLVYGQNFLQASVYLRVLLLILPFLFTKSIIEKILYSCGMQLQVSIIYATGVFLNVVLNLIAIPRFGILGASATTIICEILMTSGILFYLKGYSSGRLDSNIALTYAVNTELLDD